MMVRNIHESFLRFFGPIIRRHFPARITEATFTGMSDIMLRSALFAFVETVSEFVLVSAVHHLFYVFFYTIADIVYT